MQSDQLKAIIYCSSCRVTIRVEVIEVHPTLDGRSSPNDILSCPICSAHLDENEIDIRQRYKDWREIWQDEKDSEKKMRESIDF